MRALLFLLLFLPSLVLGDEPSSQGAVVYTRSLQIADPSGLHGAEVFLDGAFVGVTPLSIEASLGAHVLVVRARGFQDLSTIVEISKDGATIPQQLAMHQTEQLAPIFAPQNLRKVSVAAFLSAGVLYSASLGMLLLHRDDTVDFSSESSLPQEKGSGVRLGLALTGDLSLLTGVGASLVSLSEKRRSSQRASGVGL